MAPSPGAKRKRRASKKLTIVPQIDRSDGNSIILNWDVWSMICRLLRDEDRRHLYNLCLVSKDMNMLATPNLYYSLVLGPAPQPVAQTGQEQVDEPTPSPGLDDLVCRFRNDRKGVLRAQVHVLTILAFDRWSRRDEPFGEFVYRPGLERFVARLPNLRLVRLLCHIPSTNDDLPSWLKAGRQGNFIHSVRVHPRNPELHLLGEGNERKWSGRNLPCVSTLHIQFDHYQHHYYSPRIGRQPFHRLIFACPNLRSLSLSGPVDEAFRMGSNPEFKTFERFPPIEELSLNGYIMEDYEWDHWRTRFLWGQLSSLSLGPKPIHSTLSLMAGHGTQLKHLKVEAFASQPESCCGGLGEFLVAFDTLETLEVRNYKCSIETVVTHTRLMKLCLHNAEPWPGEPPRPVLSEAELVLLDTCCPNLESLEIDIQRDKNQWPHATLSILAASFDHLRRLSLHVDIGIANLRFPLVPVLNYQSAKRIARLFFLERRAVFDIHRDQSKGRTAVPSKLEKLILWTGCSLRSVELKCSRRIQFERTHSATFLFFPPVSPDADPDFNHMEQWELDAIKDSRSKKTQHYQDLKKRVKAAVEGPKPWKGSEYLSS